MRSLPSRLNSRSIGEAAVLGAAYFLCAALTLQLTRFDGGVAIVWLAGALLFAKLTTVPRWRWPFLILACLPAGIAAAFLFGFKGLIALPLACISISEAVAAAWMLKRICPSFSRFQSLAEVMRFVGIAGVVAPAVGAFAGAWCAHEAGGMAYWSLWRDWYAGHALGFVGFTPPLLLAVRGEIVRWIRGSDRRAASEALGLFSAVLLACAVTFGQNRLPLVIVPLVPMIAATFRLGQFGAVASMLILMTVGLACSLLGRGPITFLHGGMGLKLQVLQIYFATVALILLPVAAALKARLRLLDRLRAAEALHRLILDRSGDMVLRLGIDGAIRYTSPSVARILGYDPEALVGQSVYELVHSEDRLVLFEARHRALARPEETVAVEYKLDTKNGASLWVEAHIRATLNDQGVPTGTVSIVRETTERRRVIEDLTRQAATDPLTGLANRRAFDDALMGCLASEVRETASGCLAVFDLDHFKRINDNYGHAKGDTMLERFSAILRASVRNGDLVARLGGEEFAVLLCGATIEQAHAVCERIRVRFASIEERSETGEVVQTTVSGGIAPLRRGSTAQAAMEAADTALYRAKNAGRNRVALAA